VLLEKKAHVTDVDAYWAGQLRRPDGVLGRHLPETTAFALKLLIRQDRSSGLMPKAAVLAGQHRDGDYWYSTKQTAMVIQGLTDYLALSGELANTSDVEVLVNGAASASGTSVLTTPSRRPGRSRFPRRRRKRRPGHNPQERQRHHLLVDRNSMVLRRPQILPAGSARAQHHARLLPAAEKPAQAHRSHHL
jgi:hypothetical protein